MATDLSRLIERAKRRQRRLALKREKTAPAAGPRRKSWGKSSPYKGVYVTPQGRFAARIRVAKTLHYLGTFPDEEAAARAHDSKARELLGDRATLNFPEGGS